MKTFLMALLCLVLIHETKAQLTTQNTSDPAITPQSLVVQDFLGAGIQVSNVTTNIGLGADPRQFARFTNNSTTSFLNLTDGIMLCTGYTDDFDSTGNNNSGFSSGVFPFPSGCTGGGICGPGDSDLDNIIAPYPTYDAAVLEFDFVSVEDTVLFRYVFASEEYPEFVCSDFNDVFAFFISGPGFSVPTNIATIPGSNPTLPVAINSVNPGVPGASSIPANCGLPNGSLAYSHLYINNFVSANLQFDGMTVVLESEVPLQVGATYHIKLALADAADGSYDSGIFLDGASFRSTFFNRNNVSTHQGTTIVEGEDYPIIEFELPRPAVVDYHIPLNIFGTATNGVDYTTIPNTLTIPTGSKTAQLSIEGLSDAAVEGYETVSISFQHTRSKFDTISFVIIDSCSLDSISTVDNGDGSATVTVDGSASAYQYQWSTNAASQTTATATGLPTGTYYVTVTAEAYCTLVDTVSVTSSILTIAQPFNESLFDVFPNPNSGAFTIQLKEQTGAKAIRILNPLGQIIWERQLADADHTIPANISKAPNGLYYIELETTQGKLIKRVLKQ